MESGATPASSASLTRTRCFHHPEREAAVRCPDCGRFYCRECVSEYEQRFLCAACLSGRTLPRASSGRLSRPLRTLGQCLIGVVVLWMSFYAVGRALLAVPTPFHEQQESGQMRQDAP